MRRFPTRRRVLQGAGALGLAASCTDGPESPLDSDTSAPDTDTSTPTVDTCPASTERFVGRPIIYIYVDQLRWDAIGAAGNPVVPTPHIDSLAAEGVRFSACITNGPSCRPARVTMMTGLHVTTHAIRDNYCLPDPDILQSHVQRMRDDAGYYTMVVGKTHLFDAAGDHLTLDFLPQLKLWGFEDGIELPDPQMIFVESAHSDYLTDTTPVGEVDKYRRWQDYVDKYQWTSPAPDTDPWFLSTADHIDSFCARTAADFIRTYTDERPLYLQVNFPGPHKPFDPTTEFKNLVDPLDPLMPVPILCAPKEPIAPLTAFWSEQEDKIEPWDEDETAWRNLRRDYYTKVALVDAGIGEVIAALKDTGLWDEAWIVLHSDHGELLADHLLTGKVIPYDPAIRVPLIVRPPGGIAAWVDNGQVDQMDVTATLLAIAGLDPTGYGERSLHDRVLDGCDGPEAHQTKIVMFENLTMVGLRTETHKMTYDLEGGAAVELYDLVADPDEITNLVYDPAQAAVLTSLVDALTARHPLVMTYPPPSYEPCPPPNQGA